MTTRMQILYFTDPFCSWCWATEPGLFRLREVYGDQIEIRYVMGGLVEDMANFFDTANGIRSTAQVAPHWRMVGERSGQPIDERLMTDITDPHWSTWPACMAVKAAEMQGEALGAAYLRRLRRAALAERQNVAEREVYLRLAEDVPGLDVARLVADLSTDAPRQAFQADLHLAREYGATGFPTLLFVRLPESPSQQPEGIIVNGHRPYQTYVQVLNRLASGLTQREPRPIAELLTMYGPLTTRELAEITGRKPDEITAQLSKAAGEGRVARIDVPHGEFWKLVQPVSEPVAGGR